MNEKTKKLFLMGYGILMSVSVVIVGILLIFSCISIYSSGDSPFNREIIKERFVGILLPIIIAFILIVIGAVLDIVFKTEKTKNPVISLEKIKALNENAKKRAVNEQITNRNYRFSALYICSFIISVLCAVAAVVYLTVFAEFTVENLNNDVFGNLIFISPFVFIPFVLNVIVVLLNKKNKESVLTQQTAFNIKTLVSVRSALLVLAFVFIIIGIVNGGMDDVFQKAVKICTECIGLG